MAREKNPATASVKKTAPRKSTTRRVSTPQATGFVDPAQRASLIANAAYFRAERRGFAPGRELEDWLAAEAEVDAHLLRAAASTGNSLA
jgi:hypothetical protein